MNSRGFTLIELIMVMLLTGILAVVALPRLFDRNTFDTRGFHDEVLAALRYAQKTAIAQRRDVCVAFTSNSVTLTIATAPSPATCGTAVASDSMNLAGPTGTSPYKVSGKTSSVLFVATPSGFKFNALGQPSPNSRQSMQVSGAANSITVEQETGYVHQ
ncbi:prepilin-type N-terminal cleavage/methylation domain-containing protein [Oxalobacteraceae bacterium OM1]|nr:prepilin-type N-terminal cleavage/methylation domain-containing protein [Oxalobacteraceae bacterium OM1]